MDKNKERSKNLKKEFQIDDEKKSSQRPRKYPDTKGSKDFSGTRDLKDGEPIGKDPRTRKNKSNPRKPRDDGAKGKGKSDKSIKFYTINGRNGATVNIPNISDIDLSVLDIDLDISELLKQPSGSESFLSSEFCSGLDSIVRAYSTARGYVTTTSGKVVANALRLSIRAFSLLCAIYRTQACCNIKAQNNLQISQLFTRKSTSPVNSTLYLLLSDQTPTPTMIDEFRSISNAVWMQDYVSHLSKMYLPKSLVDVLAYLYTNVFTAEAGKGLGTNSLLLFWPYSGHTSINDAYATTVTALNSLYNTYPDLELMMKVCGFGPESALSYDFTRPLAGNELSIVYDPDMPRLLENIGALDCGYESFNSAAYTTYFEYDSINSIFAYEQMKTIDTAHNLLFWMLNFAALSKLNVTLYPSAGDLLQVNGGLKVLYGGNINEKMYLPDNIHYFFDDWSSLSSSYQAQLENIMSKVAAASYYTRGITGLVSRNSILVKIEVSVDPIDNELSFQISKQGIVMLDGSNNYSFDINEASVIMRNALPTLIYGQEWRTQLQLVYLNIANDVSSIKY